MTEAGVYRREDAGRLTAVHRYEDDDYELADVARLLDLGTVQDDGGELRLARRELRLLRVTADAQSFDHPEAFIRMCVAISELELAPEADGVMLVSVG